jgi:hypothetical protein
VCPVAPSTATWITSPRSVVANLIIGHEVAAAEFAEAGFAHTRSVNVPGLRVGIGQMIEALKSVAGEAVAARVKWQIDPVIDRIVATWPANFAPVLGPALGMGADRDFQSVIRQYIEDERPVAAPH